MADPVRLARLLRSIADDLAYLTREADARAARRADPMWLRGVKYTFVTAIEGCVDVAQHVCATSGWGPPHDNGHAMLLLGEHQILPTDLAARMVLATGFRNVLVHDYIVVDDRVVTNRLGDLSDLRDFVSVVANEVLPGD
ncbi:MAG: HepT-like ribonuclease domain-containing protein [Ornithinimicrobium sp.]